MNRLAWHLVGWSAQAAFGLLCLSLMWFLQLSTLAASAQPWSVRILTATVRPMTVSTAL